MTDQRVERRRILTAVDFNVARQLTYELSNVPQESLVQDGWNAEVKTTLKKLMYSVARDLGDNQTVELVVFSADYETVTELNKEQVGKEDDQSVRRYMPVSIAEIWPKLLRTAWQSLGAQEARYRTGYNEKEIEAALQAIDGL